MSITRKIMRQWLPALLLVLLSSCAGKNGGQDGYGGWGNDGYGDSPYPNPDGGVYVDEIPLTDRDGVNFYGSNVNRNLVSPVYFEFDSYVISSSEMQKVRQAANQLRGQGSGMSLILAGHTDEVGTSEYNRNLGELRALAVRSALAGMGVEPGRIQTVSFGEDRPAQSGNDAMNRRAEFGFYR